MKIAIFIDVFPHLNITFVINQITALIDRGHEVDIFAFSRGKEKIIHDTVYKYSLLDKTYFFNIPHNIIIRFVKAFWLFILNFHKDPYYILQCFNFKQFGQEVLSLRLFYVYLVFRDKKDKYDIIHAHFGPSGNTAVKLKDLGIKSKMLVTFYGYDFSQYVRERGRAVYQYLFSKIDKVITISQYVADKINSLGCPVDKIICLPLPLNISNFIFKERRLKEGETIRILTIARLVEKKGLFFSINAVVRVLKKYSNLKYTIIGNGPLRYELNRLIHSSECQNKIIILPGQEYSKIIEEYNQSHIFILSSVTAKDGDEEGQGLVLQEAQASGLPVITTLHNGIPEGVLDGKSGFLVPEKNVDALAEKLEYLITHPELWPQMGRCGRKFVEEKYDIGIIIERLIRIYENLLNN